MCEIWKTLFTAVLNKHAPIREKRVKNKPSVPWLTNTVKQQIRERDRLKLFAVKNKSESHWKAYKLSRNRVTGTLRKAKASYYKAQFEKVKHDPKAAWKTINQILNRKQMCQEINAVKTQNGEISDPTELAECFNNYFINVGPDIAKTIDKSDRNFMGYITKATSKLNFQAVSESTVQRLLLSLNPRKSTGIDKIPAKIIRVASPVVANSLTKIFNRAISNESFPSEWKQARVVPLHKKGSRNLLNNYRPISILPALSKVFERILYEQLYDYFVGNNLLSHHQYGFRQFHSTASVLLDSTNEWFVNMDRGFFNIAVFLDLQKAFDTIDHDILLKKLDLYGLEKSALNLLKSYLTNRTQICFVNGTFSSQKLITCGVPQGSILGPLLFLIYINDLPNSLQYSSARMFADDTTLTASGKSISELQVTINHDLANVKQWLSANKLSLNLIKTEYLLIGSRHNINNISAVPNVSVGDVPIKRVRETKALGVCIDEFLSWDKHIDKIAKKVSSGIGAIRKLKSCVDRNTLICAYNALILPHFDYCCEVWDTIGVTLSDRLQKLQNRAARVITGRKNEHGQSELALNELNFKPLKERRTQFIANLMYKITHGLAPKKLIDIFQKTLSSQNYNLRGSATKLYLPKPKTEYLKKGFSYRGAKLWNGLSDEQRNIQSLSHFNSSVRHLAT